MIFMKHFITAISLAKDLKTTVYKNAESVEFLETDREFSHPILVPIQNLAESGEKIKVTVILTSKTSPFVKQNYEHFVGELNRLRDEIGFDYGEINLIEASYDESSSKHLKLFESIINSIGSDVSALFYINNIMGRLSYAKPKDPLAFIRPLLNHGEDGDKDE